MFNLVVEKIVHALPQWTVAVKLAIQGGICFDRGDEDRLRLAALVFHGKREECAVGDVADPGPARPFEVDPAAVSFLLDHGGEHCCDHFELF